MRIVDLLSKESILLNASPASKQEAINMLVDLQVKGGRIADKEAYKKGTPIILGHKWNTICTTDCRCNFCYCYCVYGSTSS